MKATISDRQMILILRHLRAASLVHTLWDRTASLKSLSWIFVNSSNPSAHVSSLLSLDDPNGSDLMAYKLIKQNNKVVFVTHCKFILWASFKKNISGWQGSKNIPMMCTGSVVPPFTHRWIYHGLLVMHYMCHGGNPIRNIKGWCEVQFASTTLFCNNVVVSMSPCFCTMTFLLILVQSLILLMATQIYPKSCCMCYRFQLVFL